MTYRNHLNPKQTPQSEPIPGQPQVQNSAGGFVYQLDIWQALQRWLILGAEGGTYYATEQKLTLTNADTVRKCIAADGPRTVQQIIEVSDGGRAPKNEPAIMALALCILHGDMATRSAAYQAVPRVCRIGTHLYHLAAYLKGQRGWGRGLRSAFGKWYAQKSARDLAYELIKYQQRDGWSARDLIRLSHAKMTTSEHDEVIKWLTKGWEMIPVDPPQQESLQLLWVFESMKRAQSIDEVERLMTMQALPREAVPTQWLNDRRVWLKLLPTMGLTAILRNLATMTRAGAFEDLRQLNFVIQRLKNEEALKKARIHPIAVLTALLTYQQGHGERGGNTWTPLPALVSALNDTFYASFGAVEPTNKRLLLALDVSGSMDMGSIAGIPNLTPRKAVAAMALVTQNVEIGAQFVAFTAGSVASPHRQLNSGITELTISSRSRLDAVAQQMAGLPMGSTDVALPMVWALQTKKKFDAFVVYTDNETWAGNIHPVQALRQYRQEMGIDAKLIVVGMTATNFTVADPADAGMLDVVGFDSAAPNIMSEFITPSPTKRD